MSDILKEAATSLLWLVALLFALAVAAVLVYIVITIIVTGGLALWKAIRTGEYTTLEEFDHDNRWKP